MGQNPAVGSQHSGLQRRALAHLKWLVVRDLSELETATFWRDGPEVRSGEMRPEDIQTEVFLMPAASHVEKDGHFTNTQRLLQWHDKAIEPPGDARSELWFMHHLFKRVRAHYAGSTEERDWPIVNLAWDYPEVGEIRDPDAEAVLKEINGYDVATGEPVSGFAELEADGSTASGCWIYAGVLRRRRQPDAAPRPRRPRLPRRLGLARVGVGVAGQPPRALQPRVRRPARAGPGPSARSTSGGTRSRASGRATTCRTSRPTRRPATGPSPTPKGMAAIGGTDPFIMMADGKGWLYSPAGLLDGPMPAHYEPLESPVTNLLYPEVGCNPAALTLEPPGQPGPRRGRQPLPVRRDDVPAHRAPHRRRDEPQPALAGRAAAGDVRRDRPDPGHASAASRTAAGW